MNNSTNNKNKPKLFLNRLKKIIFGKNIFQVFLRVYIAVVLLGAVLLYSSVTHANWEISDKGGNAISHQYTFWDALFISCSAFSNTGLTTLNVSTFYNFFGEFIIFALIGLGGIGIISLVFLVWNFFRKSDEVKINQLVLLQSERGASKFSSSFKAIRFTIVSIVLVEIIFGFIMSFWLCWFPSYVQTQDVEPLITHDTGTLINAFHHYPTALWQGMFCSVSAMNNAGFDIFENNNSLASFRNDWNIIFQLFTLFLIVMGGIGYPLIYDFYERRKVMKRGLRYRLSLFTKICLFSYLAIFIFGLILAYSFEYSCRMEHSLMKIGNDGHAFGKCEWLNRNWVIFYNTAVTRSAGFSTVNQNVFTAGNQVNYAGLMFVGGSPSSTAGGIRTTTFAIVIMSIWQLIRGRKQVSAFKRTIPTETVKNSFIVFVVAMFLILFCSLILYYSWTADHSAHVYEYDKGFSFLQVLFEVSSAFGTVGLSMGISSIVGPVGLMALTLCMFVGQLGISSTLLAWMNKWSHVNYITYSEEEVKIG